MKTRFMLVLESFPDYLAVRDSKDKMLIQSTLDAIAPRIFDPKNPLVTPEEVVTHMAWVYEETGEEYADGTEHRNIVDALITFMDLPQLKQGSTVVEVGCGPLARDALFMSLDDPAFRTSLMGGLKNGVPLSRRVPVPTKMFNVIAVDNSSRIVALAHQEKERVTEMYAESPCVIIEGDMHNLNSGVWSGADAIWACASLFTHTPQALVAPAIKGLARNLKSKGAVAVSYPVGSAKTPYDQLRYSRTGFIKYFSRPSSLFITLEFEKAGFYLMGEETGNLTQDGVVSHDFFLTQFYIKSS